MFICAKSITYYISQDFKQSKVPLIEESTHLFLHSALGISMPRQTWSCAADEVNNVPKIADSNRRRDKLQIAQ